MQNCRDSGDYAPILFEWYKFVGSLTASVMNIQRQSPAYKAIPSQHYHVLIGLLNRCARLMLSNVALSHEGRFGETTAIVDRCIFESAVKMIWLCTEPSQDKFTRFLGDGLKPELEFKAKILNNIASRGGKRHPIEDRMLGSIDRHIAASGLNEVQIADSRRLPDLASMLTHIGFDRLAYIAGQRMGSHHVHGTWTSLLSHYLEEEEAGSAGTSFVPRDHDCSTHINQYMFGAVIVLGALTAYLHYALEDDAAELFTGLFTATEKEVMRVYTEAVGGDLTL